MALWSSILLWMAALPASASALVHPLQLGSTLHQQPTIPVAVAVLVSVVTITLLLMLCVKRDRKPGPSNINSLESELPPLAGENKPGQPSQNAMMIVSNRRGTIDNAAPGSFGRETELTGRPQQPQPTPPLHAKIAGASNPAGPKSGEIIYSPNPLAKETPRSGEIVYVSNPLSNRNEIISPSSCEGSTSGQIARESLTKGKPKSGEIIYQSNPLEQKREPRERSVTISTANGNVIYDTAASTLSTNQEMFTDPKLATQTPASKNSSSVFLWGDDDDENDIVDVDNVHAGATKISEFVAVNPALEKDTSAPPDVKVAKGYSKINFKKKRGAAVEALESTEPGNKKGYTEIDFSKKNTSKSTVNTTSANASVSAKGPGSRSLPPTPSQRSVQESPLDGIDDEAHEVLGTIVRLPKGAFMGEDFEIDSIAEGDQLLVTAASDALSASGIDVGCALISIDTIPCGKEPKDEVIDLIQTSPESLITMEVRTDPKGYRAFVEHKAKISRRIALANDDELDARFKVTIDVGNKTCGVAINTLGVGYPVFMTKLSESGEFYKSHLVKEGQEIVSINGTLCLPLTKDKVVGLLKTGTRLNMELRENPQAYIELKSRKAVTKSSKRAIKNRENYSDGNGKREELVCKIPVPAAAETIYAYGMEIEDLPVGAVVVSVEPGGLAHAAGIVSDMLLTSVNKSDVRTATAEECIKLLLEAEIEVVITGLRPRTRSDSDASLFRSVASPEKQQHMAKLRALFPRVRTHHLESVLNSSTSLDVAIEVLTESHGKPKTVAGVSAPSPSKGSKPHNSRPTATQHAPIGPNSRDGSTQFTQPAHRVHRQTAVRRLRLTDSIKGFDNFGMVVEPVNGGGLMVVRVDPRYLAGRSGVTAGMEIMTISNGSGKASGRAQVKGMSIARFREFIDATVTGNAPHLDIAVKLPHGSKASRQTSAPGSEYGYGQPDFLATPDEPKVGQEPRPRADTNIPMERNVLYGTDVSDNYKNTGNNEKRITVEKKEYEFASSDIVHSIRKDNVEGHSITTQKENKVFEIQIPEGSSLGIHVERVPRGIIVISVTAGSPAAKAGFEKGMLLIRVNRINVHMMSRESCTQLLNGVKDSVKITASSAQRMHLDDPPAVTTKSHNETKESPKKSHQYVNIPENPTPQAPQNSYDPPQSTVQLSTSSLSKDSIANGNNDYSTDEEFVQIKRIFPISNPPESVTMKKENDGESYASISTLIVKKPGVSSHPDPATSTDVVYSSKPPETSSPSEVIYSTKPSTAVEPMETLSNAYANDVIYSTKPPILKPLANDNDDYASISSLIEVKSGRSKPSTVQDVDGDC